MRVLLSTFGSRGDVEPLAALAVRLKEAGAEVRIFAPPDEEIERLLAGAGVPQTPFGPSVRSLVTGARPPSPDTAFRLARDLVAERFAMLGEAAEGCDAVVATGLMPIGARSVAEKLGVPYVCAAFTPIGLPSPHHPPGRRPGPPPPPEVTGNKELWEFDAQRVAEMYGEAHNEQRAAIGLPPIGDHRDHALTGRPWLAADPTLCPWQEQPGHDVVQTGTWILRDERPLPAELEAFLEAGAPPVYVGFGSMAVRDAPDVARVAAAAVRAHGRRVVLASGWAGLALDGEEGDCLVVGEVNHQALFPRVAAVVHHGGAGTTAAAALAGAPQVVVPQVADQPYWAGRVAALGIGAAHDGPVPTVESLSAALGTALTPRTAVRAKAVAGGFLTDGARAAAMLLLETISRGRPPGGAGSAGG
ncbi:MAG: glycosyltransferase family 1 protein [Thermoactinospora sp.]|nr:glycosyltransferase family 1 protein [Thermoactinospora sp.]